jgi:hypothetical protein
MLGLDVLVDVEGTFQKAQPAQAILGARTSCIDAVRTTIMPIY